MPVPEYHWYAIYTNPRAEKKTALLLNQRGVEVYLPLLKSLKQWSDRKKWVEDPLFRSYVFVRVSEREYLDVLQVYGVVKYITFSGKAAIIRDDQIDNIKLLLSSESELDISDHHFEKGESVVIKAGPFLGLKGELIETKNAKRFLVRFDQLGKSIVLNIPSVYLEPVF
jgi:transcriptional antiterminator RfaH